MGFDRAGVSPGAPGARPEDGAEGAADRAVLGEVIRWRIKLQYNTADASAWQAFDAWLRAQPAHALVWARLQALGARLQRPAAEMPAEAAARQAGCRERCGA